MHEYASLAEAHIAQQGSSGVPSSRVLRALAASCRSFTRLVLRLRAQAEADAAARAAHATAGTGAGAGASPVSPTSPVSPIYPIAPPTPTHSRHASLQSAAPSSESHASYPQHQNAPGPHSPRTPQQAHAHGHGHAAHAAAAPHTRRFSSPLFRPQHAPVLRLFVPSPNGAWLSDESVLECEKELKRAGVLHLMRAGDVVWDAAVMDEMNAGRLLWDGNYLIDLDYNYSPIGELPRYLHSLAFPPSYFHKVIRATGNPLCQIDITPWGTEIANGVRLLQDRVVTESAQGSQHAVLRWVHRSQFQIRAGQPIPDTEGLVVDAKWAGTIVIETEGTNEGLADLLGRCGEQVSAAALHASGGLSAKLGKGEAGRVFRLLRARSRPGEIWLRCVSEKERVL
ncbi:hypothetical protein K439DRAFT_1363739 [Ramaria rubella]|nr:hypothetical protein K439DRAFT_1363739 [Ramaria rubella]